MTRRWWCQLAWLGRGPDADAGVLLVVDDEGYLRDVVPGTPIDQAAGATRLAGLTIPGLVNGHSHAFHRALRGRTNDSGSFWSWRDEMYHVAARLSPESYLDLATATFAEMALSGITTVGEFHYLHHDPAGQPYRGGDLMADAIVQAAAVAGVRLTLLDVCYLAGGIGAQPDPVQRRFSDGDAERWAVRMDAVSKSRAATVNVGAAIHSVRAVPPESMTVVSDWAAAHGAPLHAHVSEQPAENEASLAAYGLTPTGVLADRGVLGPRFVAVHATHLSDEDIHLLGRSRSSVCLCPTTERDLADGIGPAHRLRAAGSGLCLGTDSHAVINLLEEARAVELDERLVTGKRGLHAPADLLSDATVGGANALGWPECGRLAPGYLADFVTVKVDGPHLAGTLGSDGKGAASSMVFCGGATDVTTVVVGGRCIVAEGQHLTFGDIGPSLDRAIRRVLAD